MTCGEQRQQTNASQHRTRCLAGGLTDTSDPAGRRFVRWTIRRMSENLHALAEGPMVAGRSRPPARQGSRARMWAKMAYSNNSLYPQTVGAVRRLLATTGGLVRQGQRESRARLTRRGAQHARVGYLPSLVRLQPQPQWESRLGQTESRLRRCAGWKFTVDACRRLVSRSVRRASRHLG